MSDEDPKVTIEAQGDDQITIKFPKGTKAVLQREVPLDKLLETIGAPDADVEGQGLGPADENPCRVRGYDD